jgi:hypothetical protein
MIVRQQFGRIDPPTPRHAEMEDQRVATIAIDKPIFRAPPQSADDRARHPLAQVDGDRFAQIRTARLHPRQALAKQYGLEPADGGFDFGEFWHADQLGCVCPRHKARLERQA